MAKYKIYTDTASDLAKDIREKYGIGYFQMGLVVDGRQTVADLDWGEFTFEEFYKLLSDGHDVKTTLITVETFHDIIEAEFKKGNDVLYLGCSTALTGSINSFNLAKEILQEKYPERKMVAIPTFAASVTLGLMVVDAAKLAQKGASMEEVCKWVEDNRFFYNQFCTVDTLTYLKKAGRVKGTAAFFGNLMGVKPLFISDRKGNNLVIEKVKGTKASLDAIYNHIKEVIDLSKDDRIVVLHAVALDRAEALKKRFEEELGSKHVVIAKMGPIVGTTCGPNTIAAFCYGAEVTRYEGDGK